MGLLKENFKKILFFQTECAGFPETEFSASDTNLVGYFFLKHV